MLRGWLLVADFLACLVSVDYVAVINRCILRGLWDDYAEIPNFSDFSASDDEVFSDSEDESEQAQQIRFHL